MEKPVVATDVGGVREMMSDKTTGFLVKEGVHQDLIHKLTLLLADKELSANMGKQGRVFVESTFSWQKIAANFLKNIQPHVNQY
jgi:glycosyltransferase involved in cell wall biosynthesis